MKRNPPLTVFEEQQYVRRSFQCEGNLPPTKNLITWQIFVKSIKFSLYFINNEEKTLSLKKKNCK